MKLNHPGTQHAHLCGPETTATIIAGGIRITVTPEGQDVCTDCLRQLIGLLGQGALHWLGIDRQKTIRAALQSITINHSVEESPSFN